MRSARLIVRPHRPYRGLLAGVVALVAIAAVGYLLLTAEKSELMSTQSRLAAEARALAASKARLQERNAELRQRVSALEHSRDVERRAYDRIETHLGELQEEILALKEEVAFYQGIVESDQGKGLGIHRFLVQRLVGNDSYRFRIVLTRNMKSDKVASGTVSLTVAGEQEGRVRELTMEELSSASSGALGFQFKYFQRLEGRLRLPAGFVPREVHVRVDAPGEHPSSFEKSYDWQAVMG